MKSMQSKMLAEFDRLITTIAGTTLNGFDAVQVAQYANTGHLHAQRGFRTMLDIDYSFQSDYCTLVLTGPVIDRLVEQGLTCDNPPQFRVTTTGNKNAIAWHHLDYGTERVEQMFNTVADVLQYATTL